MSSRLSAAADLSRYAAVFWVGAQSKPTLLTFKFSKKENMASQANRLESLKSIREYLHGKPQPIRDRLEDMEISEAEYSQIVDDFNT